MSDAPNTAPAASHGDGHGHGHHESFYVRIWGVLLVLLVISVVGPIIGEKMNLPTLTLITAFGIALVKAYLVIKHFMHLTIEKRYIGWLMLTMLAFMLIFVAGVSPDVMKHEGQRWVNTAAQDVVKKGLEADAAKPHGEGH
jgi:caa(3)-type oxidase subunit IV